MSERVVTVVPEAGLHARPATKFVEAVQAHDSEVTVAPVDGESVSAGSILAVTSLGVESGEDVRITADGPDEATVLDELEAILSTPEAGDGERESTDDADEAGVEDDDAVTDGGRADGCGGRRWRSTDGEYDTDP